MQGWQGQKGQIMGSDLFNLRAKRADANGDYELTIVWEGGRGWDKGKDSGQGGVGRKSSTMGVSWHKIVHPCKRVAGVAGRLGRDAERLGSNATRLVSD